MMATMSSVLSSTRTLLQMFDVKIQAFANEIENDHMVWLFEIQHEANRIFSSDFSAEPELMPKTPSQKKRNRRKRLSVGQNENRNKRRFSKGKRSDLRRSSVSTSLNLIAEDEGGSPVTREELVKPSRARRTKQTTQPEVASPVRSTHKGAAQTSSFQLEEAQQQVSRSISQILEEEAESKRGESSSDSFQPPCFTPRRPPPRRPPLTQSHITKAVVKISASERQSAELQMNPNAERSPGRAAIKIVIAAATHFGPRRSSVRLSLAGLRNSMTQESVRRASRRSFLKKARLGSSTCSSNVSGLGAVSVAVRCFTRSLAQTPSTMPTPASIIKAKTGTPGSGSDGSGKKPPSSLGPRLSAKRRVAAEAKEDFQTPGKKPSPLKKSQSVRPNVRSVLHTVQKNQMMPMTPGSLGRSTVMKPFIQHTTPDRVDLKSGSGLVERECLKLEALKKKQEQEEERRKREEMKKKKRDERLRRVVEARVKEEQKDKKILQIEKHDTLQVEHMAEEKAKEKVAAKRQDELELRRRRRKKIQQAEEEKKRHQELQTKRRAEEEQERTRKMAEARLAMEEEQERTRKMESERRDAAERQKAVTENGFRVKREQTFALQREVDRAARERERKELRMKERRREEQQRRAEEERQREAARQTETEAATTVAKSHLTAEVQTPVGKGGLINGTADIKQSPQSYEITPKGGDKPVVLNPNAEDYGMDQNSEDSTDDESAPRKPIPKWAKGDQLKQSMKRQYFNPTDVDCHYGEIEPPMLNHIFYKNKPRYLKRTSSGIWYSPPKMEALPI
ncbi:inner centromere protein-like [Oncorhynchus clarkii lewisi]|uniref:inner centromere protein-like n=1 Tax=Oncorhynchus clarkii lewisi TaxID=490388 RepID=UPI0039B9B002